MKPFRLPETFRFGTATASLQIEGGDTNNNWYRWCQKEGAILDGTSCEVANDHWNRIDEDVALMKELNMQVYRMSLEWSRIEPEKGRFDEKAIAHYRDEILSLRKNGIEPLVTLHHFSNPLWLEDSGAWTNEEVIDLFEGYTEYVVRNLGDIVSDWATINEPNVYLYFSFVEGIWPPGEKCIRKYFKGAKNMIRAHIRSYRKIHAVRKGMGYQDTRVGVAHHLRVFQPKGGILAPIVARLYDRLFQQLFIRGMGEGKLLFPIGSGYPEGKGSFQDFFGINYYTRDIITVNPLKLGEIIRVKEGAPTNDLGWEIYPEGIYILSKKYYEKYGKPVFITENGTCDEKDAFRTKYIYDHLFQLYRLIEDGVDVQRYYHWTLMDNFEWIEGLSARFGLIEVHYETQERTVRQSGRFYAEAAHNGGVTQEMIEKYL